MKCGLLRWGNNVLIMHNARELRREFGTKGKAMTGDCIILDFVSSFVLSSWTAAVCPLLLLLAACWPTMQSRFTEFRLFVVPFRPFRCDVLKVVSTFDAEFNCSACFCLHTLLYRLCSAADFTISTTNFPCLEWQGKFWFLGSVTSYCTFYCHSALGRLCTLIF